MKNYAIVIAYISIFLGGIGGLFKWVASMSYSLDYGDTLMFVIKLVCAEILIPFYGILPAIGWFILLFIVGIPFYGIYCLFKHND